MATKLLLVDDEPLVTEELQEALEFEGYDVETAQSVAEALEYCANAPVDLVVTDLKMPQATGLDLIRALGGQTAPPHIIVLSGHGAESNRAEAMALGAVECFAKPVDPDDLVKKIQEVLPFQ
ncbi:MAG: response regulator [Pseudomonadota bacterium]